MGKDAFLKLLVAQLKYQNPLEPTDPSAFMTQTAQFTMVEKLENMAKESSELLQSQKVTTATSMIGQKVTAQSTTGADVVGIVTGVHLQIDGPVLKVNGQDVPLARVTDVGRS